MAALARLYRGMGVRVTGCDSRAADSNARSAADRLTRLGVDVRLHGNCRFDDGTDLLVHTLAVAPDHPEPGLARRSGVRTLGRTRALAELLPRLAGTVVAISGVTGKTTVTGLVAQLQEARGVRPTLYVGGDVDGLTDRPHLPGSDRLAVVEACEVRRGMLDLPATVAAVTSIYWGEHPASYPTLGAVEDAFAAFVMAAPIAVLPAAYRRLARGGECLTFGTEATADVRLVSYWPGSAGFRARYRVGGRLLVASTRLHGEHNARNLAAAFACHLAAGGAPSDLAEIDLRTLRPPRRRIERLGATTCYDDFGHNPMQIAAAYDVLRTSHPRGQIGTYVQPAGFARLGAFGVDRFADVLQRFDRVHIAPARSTFEDTAATPSQEDFADRLAVELRRRGVEAGTRPLSPPVVEDLRRCAAACLFGILPMAAEIAAMIGVPGRPQARRRALARV
jgi:UDP-N-acetylmuramate--alanine ligase